MAMSGRVSLHAGRHAPVAAVVLALAPAVAAATAAHASAQRRARDHLDLERESGEAGIPSFADDDEVYLRSPVSPGYFLIVGNENHVRNVRIVGPSMGGAEVWRIQFRTYDDNGVCNPCLVSLKHRDTGLFLQPPGDTDGLNALLGEKQQFFTMKGAVADNNNMEVNISRGSTHWCLTSPPPDFPSDAPVGFEECGSSSPIQQFTIKSTTLQSGDEVLVRRWGKPHNGGYQYMTALLEQGGHARIAMGVPARVGNMFDVGADAREVPTMVWTVELADATGKRRMTAIKPNDSVFIKVKQLPGKDGLCAEGPLYSHYMNLPGKSTQTGVQLDLTETEPAVENQARVISDAEVVAYNTPVRLQKWQGKGLFLKCVLGPSGSRIPFEGEGCPSRPVSGTPQWMHYVKCDDNAPHQILTFEVA